MHRRSAAELGQLLSAAHSRVVVGGRYAHFKHPERRYTVESLAIAEATEEVVVVYKALYGEGLVFVRSLSSWCEAVAWEGKTVPRFSEV